MMAIRCLLLPIAILLCSLGLLAPCFADQVPWAPNCDVYPAAYMQYPRFVGIPTSSFLSYHFTEVIVKDYYGDPIPNCLVTIVLEDQDCLCQSLVLEEYTDDYGYAPFFLQYGGFTNDYDGWVWADTELIYGVEHTVSPDYDGTLGNCEVSLADFTAWGGGGQATQFDYNGDGYKQLGDFVIFGAAWGHSCTPQ